MAKYRRYTIENGLHKNKNFFQHVIPLFALIGIFGVSFLVYQKTDSGNPVSEPVSALSAQDATSPQAAKVELSNQPTWPTYGHAAYGTNKNGVVAASTSKQEQVPIASLAKVITALAVMKQKPLQPGQQGPTITITEQDIKIYEEYVAKSGAVVPVQAGEQITQYQMMQAMLQPSANNMADALVRWAFGSVEAYNAYANQMLKEMGIQNTTISDASGYSPKTTSTAQDMVLIGAAYMKQPLLKEIAMQPGSTIPFAGPIRNYNAALNKDGIIGIKIGNTDEAGRCFLVADMRDANNISIAVTLGASTIPKAMEDAIKLIKSGNQAYDQVVATKARP